MEKALERNFGSPEARKRYADEGSSLKQVIKESRERQTQLSYACNKITTNVRCGEEETQKKRKFPVYINHHMCSKSIDISNSVGNS
jgi:hypothetical protein